MRSAAMNASLLVLAEAALLAVWAPLLGLFTAMRVWPGQTAGRSPAVELVSGAWRLGRPLLVRISLITGLSAAAVVTLRATMVPGVWLQSHAILWSAALALAAFGALCGRMSREPLDAAACAVGLALLTAFALFAAGPVLDSIPAGLLHAALAANPIVATAAAASIDIFRMDLLYQLSPLAHRQVDYPSFTAAFGAYVSVAVVLLFLSARQVTSR